jgi:sterol desaturase/sphingolipid hydroxylase (fatty acid hydroxylase superfamily)
MIFIHLLILFLYANLLEYAIHRWAEHGPLWESNHQKHHEDPETPTLFLHSAKGVAGLAALIGLSAALFSPWGWLPLAFFLLYYLVIIEAAHYVAHRFHISKHHMRHHADLQEGNYNVWIPLGDILFGTRIKK